MMTQRLGFLRNAFILALIRLSETEYLSDCVFIVATCTFVVESVEVIHASG